MSAARQTDVAVATRRPRSMRARRLVRASAIGARAHLASHAGLFGLFGLLGSSSTGVPMMLAALAVACAVPVAAAAGQGVLLQGIADGEFWSTNNTSNLLTRSVGRPAGLGRLELWGAYEPISRFVIYGQARFEGGPARGEPGTEVYTNQFGVRVLASQAFVIDAGRFTPIIGTFATRHFSTRNPLIGEPDGYSTDYPIGVKVSGEAGGFDYRAGLVSLPTTHVGYEPEPTARLRPALGAGYTPIVGLRFGASFTVGPYLSNSIASAALDGKSWTAYQQTVMALDAQYAVGYLETHAEAARGTYDLAGGSSIRGFTYYGEAKYTLTPRLFVAARVERNKYPFIRPTTPPWTAKLTDFVDGEAGVGVRLTSSTLLKGSVRSDRWWVRPGTPGYRGVGGHAFALQLSQSFDVMNWIDRARMR